MCAFATPPDVAVRTVVVVVVDKVFVALPVKAAVAAVLALAAAVIVTLGDAPAAAIIAGQIAGSAPTVVLRAVISSVVLQVVFGPTQASNTGSVAV
jgi:hypothetical protein